MVKVGQKRNNTPLNQRNTGKTITRRQYDNPTCKSLEKWVVDAIKDLHKSGIDYDTFKRNEIRLADGNIYFPYFNLNGKPMKHNDNDFERWKCIKKVEKDKNGKDIKYKQPEKSGCRAYFPAESRRAIGFARGAIYITEGEKKALCLAQHGLPTIGLGGAWSFKNRETNDLIPELKAIKWKDRIVRIVFDSDPIDSKGYTQVKKATRQLVLLLGRLGAKVEVIQLPTSDESKCGVDDWITSFAWGKLMKTAKGRIYLPSGKRIRKQFDAMKNEPKGTFAELDELLGKLEWLSEGLIPKGLLTLLVAYPKVGKSVTALDLFARPIITGTEWFNGTPARKPGYVIWADTECSVIITRDRAKSFGLPSERILGFDEDIQRVFSIEDQDCLDTLEARIYETKAELVVVDSFKGSHKRNENAADMADLLQELGNIAQRTKTAMVVIHHFKKDAKKKRRPDDVDIRGNTGIHSMGRMVLALTNPSRQEGQFRLETLANNLTKEKIKRDFEFTSKGLRECKIAGSFEPTKTKLEQCIQLLRETMEPDKPYPKKEIKAKLKKKQFYPKTISDARTALGITGKNASRNSDCWVRPSK